MANPPFFQIFKGDHLITSSISLSSNEVEQWNKFQSWSLDKIAVRLVTGQKLASCGSLMATTVDHSSNGGSRKSYHLAVTTSSRWLLMFINCAHNNLHYQTIHCIAHLLIPRIQNRPILMVKRTPPSPPSPFLAVPSHLVWTPSRSQICKPWFHQMSDMISPSCSLDSNRVCLPSGYVKIAIENGHWNSEFSH